MRPGKLCGVISKLRHYVPRSQLIEYYRSNVVLIIKYGVLVYGYCCQSLRKCLFFLQKKIKFFFVNEVRAAMTSFSNLLSVFELHFC